jgi:hypothetical protein
MYKSRHPTYDISDGWIGGVIMSSFKKQKKHKKHHVKPIEIVLKPGQKVTVKCEEKKHKKVKKHKKRKKVHHRSCCCF